MCDDPHPGAFRRNINAFGRAASKRVIALGKSAIVRAAGINIKNGQLFLAVVDDDNGSPQRVVIPKHRLTPSEGMTEALRLADMKSRVKQELEPANIDAIGLVDTRQFNSWQYRQVFVRVTIICAAMYAAVELGIDFKTLSTEAIGKVVLCPPSELETFASADIGFETRPTYWTSGLAEAFAAAVTVLKNHQP